MNATRRPVTAASLAWHTEHRGPNRQAGLRRRLRTLLATLTGQPVSDDAPTVRLFRELEDRLRAGEPDELWLALAVLDAQLPLDATVRAAVRRTRLDGPLAALAHVMRAPHFDLRSARTRWPDVEIVSSEIVIDVHHTSRTTFATGIQRVARQASVRWDRDHDPVFIGWTDDYRALRRLDEDEVDRALHGTPVAGGGHRSANVIIPWKSTYLLPELLAEPPRAHRLLALVQYSGSKTGVIGFDCVPLTSAETTGYGMSGGFALNLAAVAHMDRVATISQGAAVEYRGWRTMLRGAGMAGPDIEAVTLPDEASAPTPEGLEKARSLMVLPGRPMVLVVGSHEPRKNHLAILHAAELVWREGLQFSLIFIGGNSWNSERFVARMDELRAQGRDVHSESAVTDELLWAAYALARFSVFPSLNEGFGLPVAESLALGTPVITSNFGSMREIGEGGGALFVNPRDDHDIADAMRALLTSDELRERLSAAARRRTHQTWDNYAERTWDYLVNGVLAVDSGGTNDHDRAGASLAGTFVELGSDE